MLRPIMQLRAKRILWLIQIIAFSSATLFVYQAYEERRMNLDEKTLNNLLVESIEFKDASLDDAVRLVVGKVHALGHPELRARVYTSSREAPYFHLLKNSHPVAQLGDKITVRLTAAPMSELLKFVGGLSGSTCEVIGHDLVVVPALGTSLPFHRATFRLYPDFFSSVSPKDISEWARNQQLDSYEGSGVGFNRKRSTVEIFAPNEEIEQLENSLSGFVRPPLWKELKYELLHWEKYPRDE